MFVSYSGGAGTLSEIALAWQFGRPIAVINDTGVGQRKFQVRNSTIEGTRLSLDDVEQAVAWIKSQPEEFSHI